MNWLGAQIDQCPDTGVGLQKSCLFGFAQLPEAIGLMEEPVQVSSHCLG